MWKGICVLVLLSLSLHLYLGQRLVPELPALIGLVLSVWLLVSAALVPAPFLWRLTRRESLPDVLSWAAYLMMGVFSSLLVLTVVRDLLMLLLAGVGLLFAPGPAIHAAAHYSAVAVVALTLLVSLVGLVNARRVAKVVEVELPLAGLPQALHGFTIAQISDIHVGPTIKRGYLDAIVTAVNALQPDMVAITGDLVDGSVARLAGHMQPLTALNARHGSFFVTGNHEYYAGVHEWVPELQRLGLTVLINEHVVLTHEGEHIVVGGVTDYSGARFIPAHESDPHAALRGAPTRVAVKLLLAHQPRSAPLAQQAGFDVQLSGHTHGGQFLPWNFLVRLQQPYTAGMHRLGNMLVYTSRGTGYWGPPLRFGAPSEITRLRLVAA